MLYMNQWEVEAAVNRYACRTVHPVLSRASRTLRALVEETNAHSDGWRCWPPPCRAAKKLQELVLAGGQPTEAQYKAALTPIKAFYSRRGNAAGMTYTEAGV